MAESFIGDIRLFGFGFTPKNWAACEGQLLPINQNQALFSILGTTYGGNGTTTFALPDLRGRAPVHIGNGINLGGKAGEAAHTLTYSEMPAHNHIAQGTEKTASEYSPIGHAWAVPGVNSGSYATTPNTTMSPNALSTAGGSQPHSNMQPYLAMNYCICTNGIFPSRN
ncbi:MULTISPECIES: phage tail protein [Bacillales]|uniref:phage tail protein n=1 Tax=Bacillales TaxID=1385 RepID=UPI0006A7E89B|nr:MULTISPECIES: tail fiber protein [Bacillales]OBZ15961.1 phage tail protein [Bacillus sp. FJAT-26390]